MKPERRCWRDREPGCSRGGAPAIPKFRSTSQQQAADSSQRDTGLGEVMKRGGWVGDRGWEREIMMITSGSPQKAEIMMERHREGSERQEAES